MDKNRRTNKTHPLTGLELPHVLFPQVKVDGGNGEGGGDGRLEDEST